MHHAVPEMLLSETSHWQVSLHVSNLCEKKDSQPTPTSTAEITHRTWSRQPKRTRQCLTGHPDAYDAGRLAVESAVGKHILEVDN